MSLLELENGDPENLEGRVIVYGYSPPEEEAGEPQDQISAMFCTTDPSDFTEKFVYPTSPSPGNYRIALERTV